MIEILLGSFITILSVIIGGILTYYIGQREIKRNKKMEVYLEFLNVAHARYYIEASELTEEYMNVLRKIYLIGSVDVLKTLEYSGYMPRKGSEWSDSDPDKVEHPLKLIVLAMRKDIGDKNNRFIKEFEFINWFYKENKK